LVHCGDKTGPDTCVTAIEVVEEDGVCEETAKERAVVAVHRLAAEADEEAGAEEEVGAAEKVWFLLDESLVEGFAAGYSVDSGVLLNISIDTISRVLRKGVADGEQWRLTTCSRAGAAVPSADFSRFSMTSQREPDKLDEGDEERSCVDPWNENPRQLG
jgi:hypothetical protein